jgi:uncharacterized membrane protein YfcA
MIWMPPPPWFFTIGFALIAQLVVVGVVFYARGWKRGAASIPVSVIFYVLSVIGGVALDISIPQLDPLPLIVVLALGVYATLALMMWRRSAAQPEDQGLRSA